MSYLKSLKDMLCKEVEEIAKKGNISINELGMIDHITNSIKNIDKIMEIGETYNDEEWEEKPKERIHSDYRDMVTEKLDEIIETTHLSLDDKGILRRAMDILRK